MDSNHSEISLKWSFISTQQWRRCQFSLLGFFLQFFFWGDKKLQISFEDPTPKIISISPLVWNIRWQTHLYFIKCWRAINQMEKGGGRGGGGGLYTRKEGYFFTYSVIYVKLPILVPNKNTLVPNQYVLCPLFFKKGRSILKQVSFFVLGSPKRMKEIFKCLVCMLSTEKLIQMFWLRKKASPRFWNGPSRLSGRFKTANGFQTGRVTNLNLCLIIKYCPIIKHAYFDELL